MKNVIIVGSGDVSHQFIEAFEFSHASLLLHDLPNDGSCVTPNLSVYLIFVKP